ncbi:YD repeat-containing protein, partial [mine drainage metagenome]
LGEEPFAEATAFLYSGSNPVQTGVQPGTILPDRAAVIRGRVLDQAGQPLAGVIVSVLNHPAYGYTVSRSSGRFDLAVDGGGWLTLDYEKTGYLEAERAVRTPLQDYAIAPTVALVRPDSRRNPVVFGAGAPLEVAEGSWESDASGRRRATVIFPAGTEATYVAPDGHSELLSRGDVRITEVTVGALGPEAMPAALPATSAYTYAVDLALGPELVGGGKVEFNQPVDLYVNDFLKFPAGTVVPVGTYRFGRGQWVAGANGIVLKVLGVQGGEAQIALSGQDVAATPAELAQYGFTGAELGALAQRYRPGTLLWRVPLRHFSVYDTNWAAYVPTSAPPRKSVVPRPDCPRVRTGCEILTESQALVEQIPLAGTGLTLEYDSARSTNRFSVDIPLTSSNPPSGISAIRLKVAVEGQSFEQTFAPGPDQSHRYVWNGLDAYGRPVAGHVVAQVSVGYVFPDFYYEGTPFFGAYGTGTFVTGENQRLGATVWRTYALPLGARPSNPYAVK